MGYLDVKHPVYVYHNILPQMATVIVLMHQMSVSVIVCLMMFNATLNNISVVLWRSVLLVEETGEPEENHRPVASH
jgi:energy-converting hydrogenase Eha subunit E